MTLLVKKEGLLGNKVKNKLKTKNESVILL